MSKSVTFAQHDPAMALAAIFQPLKRGMRPPLDIAGEFDNAFLRWRAPAAMGVAEQSVLFVIQALASQDKTILEPQPVGEIGKALRVALQAEGQATQQDAMTLDTTWRELVLLAGYADDGGRNYVTVRNAVARLAEMTVSVSSGGMTSAMRLISFVMADAQRLKIALNWRLAEAIAGKHHTRIPLDERRRLKGEPAKILHAWLAASLRPNKTWSYNLDTLAEHVWGESSKGSTQRTRRKRIKEALGEIATLANWQISDDGRVVTVSRKKTSPVETNAEALLGQHQPTPGLTPTRKLPLPYLTDPQRASSPTTRNNATNHGENRRRDAVASRRVPPVGALPAAVGVERGGGELALVGG